MTSLSLANVSKPSVMAVLAAMSISLLLPIQAEAGTKINLGDLLGRMASGQKNSTPSAEPQNEPADAASVNALARKRWNLPANASFQNTVVPDVFALRVPGRTTGACSQFVNGNVTQVANLGGRGWKLVNGGSLDQAAQLELSQRAAQSVLGQAMRVGPKTNHYPFLLISAVDCPTCRMLETQLAKLNVSYLVVPVALSAENLPAAAKIWASPDAGQAWQQVMTGRSDGPRASKSEQASYPGEAFHDVSCMFGGTTPRAIFPDGSQLSRPDEILAALKSGGNGSTFDVADAGDKTNPPPATSLPPGPPAKQVTGSWKAVTPTGGTGAAAYAPGVTCGPFTLNMYLAAGLPPGWFGNLIQNPPSGPNAVVLEFMSNLTGSTAEQDRFGYAGVNLTFAGKLPTDNSPVMEFKSFHDALVPPVNSRTRARIPRLVEPAGGIKITLEYLDQNTMRAHLDWDSPCIGVVEFHRTAVIRGPLVETR